MMVFEEQVTNEALKRAHEKGLSLAEAGRVLGMTPQGVSYRWRVMGLKPHGRRRMKKTKKTYVTFSVHPSVVRLIDSLARKLNVSKSEIVTQAVKLMTENHKYVRKQK